MYSSGPSANTHFLAYFIQTDSTHNVQEEGLLLIGW
jgi:hypothetical protein